MALWCSRDGCNLNTCGARLMRTYLAGVQYANWRTARWRARFEGWGRCVMGGRRVLGKRHSTSWFGVRRAGGVLRVVGSTLNSSCWKISVRATRVLLPQSEFSKIPSTCYRSLVQITASVILPWRGMDLLGMPTGYIWLWGGLLAEVRCPILPKVDPWVGDTEFWINLPHSS